MNIKAIDKSKLSKQTVSFLWAAFRLILLIGISYTILYPILAKFSLVFMKAEDLTDFSVQWIPKHFTFSNIKIASEILEYPQCIAKTFGICLFVCSLQVFVCTISAYGLAHFKSRLRNSIFILVLATLLIPPQTYIVSLYTQFQHFDVFGLFKLFLGKDVNILDTLWTFIVLAVTGMGIRSGLYIYILKQNFSSLPIELDEAAKVDGAGMLKTFFAIMLPNTVPTVVMCFILSFVWQWNDTFYTSYFASELGTLSMKVTEMGFLVGEYFGNWASRTSSQGQLLISVGIFLCAIPLIVIFVLCQRFFVQGVERSGLVG
ncbi:MAG: carbohydrate ABC transporter permease [Clostridia bacterium]|nr:carbohydrate ABC transporter permease [Clostridia bacterium]